MNYLIGPITLQSLWYRRGVQDGPALVRIIKTRKVPHLLVLLEELLGVLLPLPKPLVPLGEPRTRLLNHPVLDTDVHEAPFSGDALPLHDVKVHHLERRRHLVLYRLPPLLVTHRLPEKAYPLAT